MESENAHAKVPVFFVQAENDFDTTPSRMLAQEMDAAHEPNRVKIFPPHAGVSATR